MSETAQKFEGKTIIVPADSGKWYWVYDGKKWYVPDYMTGWSFGLLTEDAIGVEPSVANDIPDGGQLKYWEGKNYTLLENIKKHEDQLK